MALHSPGLVDLIDAAASPAARPSAAQLLPGTAAAEGLRHFERALLAASDAGPRELTSAAAMLLRAGGKRVRPLLTLLAARAAAPGRRARGRVALALTAELVHSATLLHDDVIDDGLTRRGQPAPRVAYGNAVSVLSGDWLLAASLALALQRLPPLRSELAQLLAANADDESLPGRVRAFATRLGRTGALGAARRAAEKERDAALAALEVLPESPTRDLLAQVAHLLLSRT